MVVTVLAVDDSAAFREAIVDVVGSTPGFELVGETDSGEEAVRLAGVLHPDMVLMDVRMEGTDGIEAAARIRSLDAPPLVVLLTAADQEEAPPASLTAADELVDKRDLRPGLLTRIWTAQAARARE